MGRTSGSTKYNGGTFPHKYVLLHVSSLAVPYPFNDSSSFLGKYT